VTGGPDDPPYRQRPQIVCLVGSLRFRAAYEAANLAESLAGRAVLTAPYFSDRTGPEAPGERSSAEGFALDALGLKKVELADEVLVLNAGGYIGPSTAVQVEYARRLGKRVRFLEPIDGRADRVSALAFRDGCVLLVRTDGGIAPPGGKVGLGELPSDAIRRVLPAQTGLRAEHVGPLLASVDIGGERAHLYSVTVAQGEPSAGADAARAWWAPVAEIADGYAPKYVLDGLQALRGRYGTA